MPLKHRVKQKAEDNSTVMLMLGLFLILLAFFILLNAISEISEDRVEAASEGVMSGFGFKNSTTKLPNQDQLDLHKVHERITKKIKQTFETYLSVKDFNLETGPPDTTVVQLNPLKFFYVGEWRLKVNQEPFFVALSHLISSKKPGFHLTMDILMPTRDETIQTENKENEDEEAKIEPPLILGGYRATQFARALIERGVDPNHLTTGVSEGQDAQIMIVFKTTITNRASALRSLQTGGAN